MNGSNVNSSKDSEWEAQSDQVRNALLKVWQNGMPGAASALYSRWWQLETWLRSLVYVELRCNYGADWARVLSEKTAKRQESDRENLHMPTTDTQDLLAYLDARPLLELTLEKWSIFSKYFPTQKIWVGKIEELISIRNRIGHCRKPHADDLDRIEQALRDLNAGAFLATSSFNKRSDPHEDWNDVLVRDWVHHEHETASRLIRHADLQYETNFNLAISRRPWAQPLGEGAQAIGSLSGYVWHASWFFRGGKSLNLAKFWQLLEYDKDVILMVCADSPSSLQLSFSSMDDQKLISDTIGRAFDAALNTLSFRPGIEEIDEWFRRYSDLDPRVHVSTPWTVVDPSMHGVSIFSA